MHGREADFYLLPRERVCTTDFDFRFRMGDARRQPVPDTICTKIMSL